MRVDELVGAQLDYWVGRAEGADFGPEWDQGPDYVMIGGHSGRRPERYSPSTDWAQGGPIIERERISVNDGGFYYPGRRSAWIDASFTAYGPTPLVAAMRAYVASKFGNEVQEGSESNG